MVGVMGNLPFALKLVVCLALDGVGIAQYMNPAIGIFTHRVYAAVEAIVGYLFWSNPFMSALVFAVEEIPAVDTVPILTLVCLWNGYKTNWKY